jgi:hypothetical protein
VFLEASLCSDPTGIEYDRVAKNYLTTRPDEVGTSGSVGSVLLYTIYIVSRRLAVDSRGHVIRTSMRASYTASSSRYRGPYWLNVIGRRLLKQGYIQGRRNRGCEGCPLHFGDSGVGTMKMILITVCMVSNPVPRQQTIFCCFLT